MHPSVKSLLGFFRYDHLPTQLQGISRPFSDLAHRAAEDLKGTEAPQELTVCLRKLLEAKDAAVRAGISCRSFSARRD